MSDFKPEIHWISANKLYISPFQRPPSEALVKKLKASIEEVGFITPLVVVPLNDALKRKLGMSEEVKGFLVVDGQHRYKAGLQLGMEAFPCIIAPKEILNYPLHLNIEKPDNIKDKAEKIYNFYLRACYMSPSASEVMALEPALKHDNPAVIPIAFAYREAGLRSPSLVEDLCKKVAYLSELPLEEAIKVRREEAEALKSLEDTLTGVAEVYGVKDFLLRKSMLAIAMKDEFGEVRGKRTYINIDTDLRSAISRISQRLTEKDWQFLTAKEVLT